MRLSSFFDIDHICTGGFAVGATLGRLLCRLHYCVLTGDRKNKEDGFCGCPLILSDKSYIIVCQISCISTSVR